MIRAGIIGSGYAAQTFHALLARPDVDLVVIPTPNDTHHRLAARAAQARRVLSVFHNRRWDGDFLALRTLLEQGTLGRVTQPHLLDQALQLWGRPQSLWVDLQRQRDGAVADDGFHAVLRYADGLRVLLHATALAAEPGVARAGLGRDRADRAGRIGSGQRAVVAVGRTVRKEKKPHRSGA